MCHLCHICPTLVTPHKTPDGSDFGACIVVPPLPACRSLAPKSRPAPLRVLLQVLEDTQLHDVCKAAMEMHSALMLIGNSLLNNMAHLFVDFKEERMISTMY